MIVASDVTAGNVGDGQAAGPLIDEALAEQAKSHADGEAPVEVYGDASCPQRASCTTSKSGRLVRIHPKEKTLQRARARQRDPAWRTCYRATRPKVERKLGHLMRRCHGGRCARVRGCLRIRQDFALLCASSNLERLALLEVRHDGVRWSL